MPEHAGPRHESQVNAAFAVAFVLHLNNLVFHHIVHSEARRIRQPRIRIVAVGQVGGNILAIQHNRLKVRAWCRCDKEGVTIAAVNNFIGCHHRTFAMILDDDTMLVFLKLSLNGVIATDLANAIMQLVSNPQQLLQRNRLSIHHQ